MDEETAKRLRRLEQQAWGSRRDQEQLVRTPGTTSVPKQTRLVKTIENSGSDYSPLWDTFDIVFVDGNFTQSSGSQSVSWSDRQASSQAVAHNLAKNRWLDKGTVIPVFWHDAAWWFCAGETLLVGKTSRSITKGTSGPVEIWRGTVGSETDSTYSLTAFNKFGDVGSGKWVEVSSTGDGWYINARECNP